MSRNAGFADQCVELDFQYPSEGIHRRWDAGFRITACAATPDQSAFVLSVPRRCVPYTPHSHHLDSRARARSGKTCAANRVGVASSPRAASTPARDVCARPAPVVGA